MEHICPSCHCSFRQEFLCTTCGAEKLKDESTRQLERAVDSYMKAYDDCRAAHTETHAKLVRVEEELAACQKERDGWKRKADIPMKYKRMEFNAALQNELAECKRDAERYRFLRREDIDQYMRIDLDGLCTEDLDNRIDAARGV